MYPKQKQSQSHRLKSKHGKMRSSNILNDLVVRKENKWSPCRIKKTKKNCNLVSRLYAAETSDSVGSILLMNERKITASNGFSICIICQIDSRYERQLDDLSQVKCEWRWHIRRLKTFYHCLREHRSLKLNDAEIRTRLVIVCVSYDAFKVAHMPLVCRIYTWP